LEQTILDAGLEGGSTRFAVFIKRVLSKNLDQNMPKNALFF